MAIVADAPNEPRRAMKAPRKSLGSWGGFFHMLARFYQDYYQAVLKAARRKTRRAIDVDAQVSKDGTAWALHWSTLGKNKLHDPKGRYGKNTRIDLLTDAEIERMRGPNDQSPYKLSAILRSCEKRGVRAEVEMKVLFGKEYMQRLMARPYVKAMDERGDLQFKTLATMGDPVPRLRVAHDEGGVTILSFTGYNHRKNPGISKSRAWPVTDYVRGSAKWTD